MPPCPVQTRLGVVNHALLGRSVAPGAKRAQYWSTTMPTVGLPKYRVTYHFNDESEGGWSESYWIPGSTFVGVESAVSEILTARLALLTNEWRCVYNVTHDTTQKGT